MAGTKVLDSWALMCYLEQEPGAEKVIELFDKAAQSSESLLMCVVNWGEVYYQVMRRLGEPKAQEVERLIQSFPILLVDADRDLTREAARLKATKRMSYADCFAAALARQHKAKLYTGDPEFRTVEKEIKITWL
ncbi:MAG: type II toxin-antitoxin system VapC family toxin [Nitrososphaera sp.]